MTTGTTGKELSSLFGVVSAEGVSVSAGATVDSSEEETGSEVLASGVVVSSVGATVELSSGVVGAGSSP